MFLMQLLFIDSERACACMNVYQKRMVQQFDFWTKNHAKLVDFSKVARNSTTCACTRLGVRHQKNTLIDSLKTQCIWTIGYNFWKWFSCFFSHLSKFHSIFGGIPFAPIQFYFRLNLLWCVFFFGWWSGHAIHILFFFISSPFSVHDVLMGVPPHMHTSTP